MKKLLTLLIILFAICTGVIYMLPNTLTKVSQTVLSEVMQTEVIVEGVDFSLLKGTFNVKNVTIKDYPKFSNDNLFVAHDVLFALDAKSLLSKTITVDEISVANLEMNLTGGIKDNSLKEVQHIIKLREEFEQQEEATKVAEEKTATKEEKKSELLFKINELRIDNITLGATITEPFKLPKKEITIKDIKVLKIGGENGTNIHQTIGDVITLIDGFITKHIEDLLPAQKVYEEAHEVVEDGLEKGKKLIKKLF